MVKVKKKTKAEELQEAVAEAVGAGREWHLESVDFSDPNRPKTCLEVDFPILPINTIATIEGKGSGALKPVYQTMKWWARRRSTVFRQLLIAAAAKAPLGETEAAKLAWDAYYGNHQKNEAFRKLKVADIFMGGGTTIVEGARLGMQMYGNDLNPVAWLVVKNELAQVDSTEVKNLLDAIEAEVKPQIMPFYACDCPRGHKGKWTHKATGEVMAGDFDPLSLTPEERADYDYEGPEVIYTFWAKHGPCQMTDCNQRTPVMTNPVVATKSLSVNAWKGRLCSQCGQSFDIEQHDARMAPNALFVVADDERPFSVMDHEGRYNCPHCGTDNQDERAATEGVSARLGKSQAKRITLTLFVHPQWMKGCSSLNQHGAELGGSATDSALSTVLWHEERAKTLRLIEFRGKVPERVAVPDTGDEFFTDRRGGTVPKNSCFTCMNDTCGQEQILLQAVNKTEKHGPLSPYAVQGFCPECKRLGKPLNGRFYTSDGIHKLFDASLWEWEQRKEGDLKVFWPRCEIPFGSRTHVKDPLPKHGFSHWWMLFNARQLLVLSQLLRAIMTAGDSPWETREALLGVFQQYLRNQNLFCFWNTQRALEPMFSNNNFNPKNTIIESSVFAGLARGDFRSSADKLIESIEWCDEPWEIVTLDGEHSHKTEIGDAVIRHVTLECCSAHELESLECESVDLVVTDPPFGGILQYAELADFFYVWLKLVMVQEYPKLFSADFTPKALEAVSNESRQGDDPDAFYQRILTECWKEAHRILKPGGILAFTFHHSEDEPWVAVLESLFEAGFYLESTFPIRGDESKGDGQFGSQKIEYDIV